MPHDFNSSILTAVAHRPWALPDRPWAMTQTWHDLLFAHWPVAAVALRGLVPPEFTIDLFEGEAWVGIVPFHMTNVAPRGVPSLPWVSEFPELNVRTYVRVGDRPGVYFLSLDAGSSLAVWAARTFLNLPYYSAAMSVTATAAGIEYESRRGGTDRPGEFIGAYEAAGPAFNAQPSSLDYFLTERYCLYHRSRRIGPYRLDIHHLPWPLQRARARLARNTMAAVNGIVLPHRAPLCHFAKRQDVVAWLPSRLR
jgi:uncharacterized protein YqjF (DUF2071 family)